MIQLRVLFSLATAVLTMMTVEVASAQETCVPNPNPIAGTLEDSTAGRGFFSRLTGASYRSRFRGGRVCSQMPRRYQQRIEEVSVNYRANGKYNQSTVNPNYPYEEGCVANYEGSTGRPVAVQICKCIHRKQLPCDQGGWNMMPPSPPYPATHGRQAKSYEQSMAAQTCLVAYQHHVGQCATPPAPAPTTPAPTYQQPATPPSNGQYGPTTPAVRPKTGHQAPPANYDDPNGSNSNY